MEHTSLDDLYIEVKAIRRSMITIKELDRLVDTIEILSNAETMEQIGYSEFDIAAKRMRRINSIQDF